MIQVSCTRRRASTQPPWPDISRWHIPMKGVIVKEVSRSHKGFTMIELIASMVVVAIISVVAGMALVHIAGGYTFSKQNAAAAEQGQVALARMAKELSAIQSVSTASAASITYMRTGDANPHTLSWTAGNPLTLDGDTLMENITSLQIAYYSYNYATNTFTASSYSSATSLIEITVQLKGASDTSLVFVDRVSI
jgi:prepilin-type N-terminal cleavage/methylation domain-containing protein